jgi:hypothetical protein
MTYEELEEQLHNSQEWTSLKDVSKLAKLVNRINLNEDYTTTLLNPKLDKDK